MSLRSKLLSISWSIDIHDAQRMNPNYFSDLLTFPLVLFLTFFYVYESYSETNCIKTLLKLYALTGHAPL